MILESGLREKKKAKQKIGIMKALVKSLETNNLNAIKIEELCKSLEISKVTFFNYFKSKEEVLYYFIYQWNFKIQHSIFLNKLSGLEAIEYIFCSIGNHKSGLNIMMSIVQYVVKQEQFTPLNITDYEYYLYIEKVVDPEIKPKTLLEMFNEALNCYNLSNDDKKRLIDLLVVGFYGVPIKSKLSGITTLSEDYREYVNSIFTYLETHS